MTGAVAEPTTQPPVVARMTIPRLRHDSVPRQHYLRQQMYL